MHQPYTTTQCHSVRTSSARMAITLCFAFGSLFAAAETPAQNTAQGSIAFNGNKAELRHAYTFVGGSLADKKREMFLIVTDKPLSPKAVIDEFERMREASSNNVQMLELKFDDGRQLNAVNFRVGAKTGGGNASSYKVDIERLTETSFKGRVHSDGEQKAFKDVHSFDVRFDTIIAKVPKPDASGKSAWATPQGKALAEYLRAARAGDKAALKRMLVADRATLLDGPNAAELIKFLKMSPDPKTAEFDSLTIDGDSAVAKLAERSKNGATSSDFTLRLVNGVWLVSP